jgi:hypothetical protein
MQAQRSCSSAATVLLSLALRSASAGQRDRPAGQASRCRSLADKKKLKGQDQRNFVKDA